MAMVTQRSECSRQKCVKVYTYLLVHVPVTNSITYIWGAFVEWATTTKFKSSGILLLRIGYKSYEINRHIE